MKDLKNKIRKKYHHLRRSCLSPKEKPNRLIIEKAKWYNNAESPVLFMIDDFANAWHSKNGNSRWDFGGDWGGGLDKNGSAISFLNENLLTDFSEAKVTFFAVAGKIMLGDFNESFIFSEPLNFSEESKAFFRRLSDNERFEIAYHGYNHGTPGEKTEDFVQEWNGFKSLEDAIKQIEAGKEIFRDALGDYPLGGKYGGWEYNEFADDSIDRTGFLWWCRDWMPRVVNGQIDDSFYEPQFFRNNFVVAIPSTIHGFNWNKKQIDKLLNKKQIISIEEHIAPVRPDGLIQAPNIIDDIGELRHLFSYLRNKNVWYATGSEIANYFTAYSQSIIYDTKMTSFKIRYLGRVKHPVLTLILNCAAICSPDEPYISVTLPNSRVLKGQQYKYDKQYYKHLVNVPVLDGEYLVQQSIEPVGQESAGIPA